MTWTNMHKDLWYHKVSQDNYELNGETWPFCDLQMDECFDKC